MKTLLPVAFGADVCAALLLVALQFFLSPLYLEMEYEYVGFPAPQRISRDHRYVASQAFLSYLNVELGGATLLALGELRFGASPFFDESDLACIFRAKELRGTAFGLTFALGAAAIALGLLMAADDFDRARRVVIVSAFACILVYTLLSLLARFAFDAVAPSLLAVVTSETCVPTDVSGLPQIFPPMIFRDALVLLALFARFAAVFVVALAWVFGWAIRISKSQILTPCR